MQVKRGISALAQRKRLTPLAIGPTVYYTGKSVVTNCNAKKLSNREGSLVCYEARCQSECGGRRGEAFASDGEGHADSVKGRGAGSSLCHLLGRVARRTRYRMRPQLLSMLHHSSPWLQKGVPDVPHADRVTSEAAQRRSRRSGVVGSAREEGCGGRREACAPPQQSSANAARPIPANETQASCSRSLGTARVH